MDNMQMHDHQQRSGWFQSKKVTWVLLGFLAVAGFFLITEHTAHLLGVLPFLIFLLCPLMMFFMMRGMHGHHGNHSPYHASDEYQKHVNASHRERPRGMEDDNE